MLKFHLDTLKVDSVANARIADSLRTIPRSIRTPGTLGQVWKTLPGGAQGWANDSAGSGGGGRTYLNGPYVDSTGALYTVSLFQDYFAQVNFGNGTTGGDSVQLVFGPSTGLLLPITAGRRLTFELVQIRTNYTGGGASYLNTNLPSHVLGSADTAFVSVHFVAVGTSPRRYWLRIFKQKQADMTALAPNLVDAGKVMVFQTELDPLTTGYFPPTTTSVQVRFTLRAKWLP